MTTIQHPTAEAAPKHSLRNSGSGYGRVVDRSLAVLRIGFGLSFLWAAFDATNWLFAAVLFGIGAALTLGITMRLAAGAGALTYLVAWAAALPPLLDQHLLGAMTLVVLALAYSGDTWGFGRQWLRLFVVSRHGVLQ